MSTGRSGGRTGSSPVISTPSWGHEHLPEVGRIHPAIPMSGIMTVSRLHLPGPTRSYRRILIRLLAAEHVERGFRQMSCHRSDRLPVSLAQAQPQVELADVALRAPRVIHCHRVGGFGKRPLQIAVHVGSRASVAHAISAGVDPRGGSPVRGQVVGAGKADRKSTRLNSSHRYISYS